MLVCGYCHEEKPNTKQERYSAGCYAGRMCDACAYSRYRDHCGLGDTPQLTQADVDEPIESERITVARTSGQIEWRNVSTPRVRLGVVYPRWLPVGTVLKKEYTL